MAREAASFSFVHAADLHLDTPFTGVHAVAPEVAQVLRDASLAAFDDIVELALSRNAAFVLIAGDVYDGAERGLRAQLHFRDGLARLADAGISSFVVHGNHDPVETGWSALGERWPEGVTVFRPGEVAVVPVVRGGEVVATVQGISYAKRETSENLARRFSRPAGAGVHIGLLHCLVQGAGDAHAEYAPCSIADLRATRLDYLALGHVHERRTLLEGRGPGEPWVVYPGNSQGRNPRATERGAKGALVVEVRGGIVEQPEFVACDRVRFGEVVVDADGLDGVGELESALRERAASALEGADGRSLILRAVLSGSGPLHGDLCRPGVVDELTAHLRERIRMTPFCWWDELVDATSGDSAAGERGDFAADLVDLQASLASDPDALGELFAEVVADAPAGFQRNLDRLTEGSERQRALLAGARQSALDELERGQ